MPRANITKRGDTIYYGNTPIDLPDLAIGDMVGQGANGKVFAVTDKMLNRKEALKVWEESFGPDQFNRALNETRKLASLDHILFVKVHSYFTVDGVICARLEYVDGVTARHWFNSEIRSVYDKYAFWNMYQSGLKLLHSNGKLHGDPHADNIMIFDDELGQYDGVRDTINSSSFGLKLTDLGTSHFLGKVPTRARESRIIKEVCLELWAQEQPRSLLAIDESDSINFTVAVFWSYANYRIAIEKLNNLKKQDRLDDVDFYKQSACRFGLDIAATPIFDLHKVVEELNSFSSQVTGFALSELKGQSEHLAKAYSSDTLPESSYEVRLDPTMEIEDVVDTYDNWREVYLSKQIYDHNDTPIWTTYR
ncbi:MAG: protein kinase family protein [candidate division Zixibacteria bacterium]|nr:protein kinase family protein [candidate division Zixibacteria bacterium]